MNTSSLALVSVERKRSTAEYPSSHQYRAFHHRIYHPIKIRLSLGPITRRFSLIHRSSRVDDDDDIIEDVDEEEFHQHDYNYDKDDNDAIDENTNLYINQEQRAIVSSRRITTNKEEELLARNDAVNNKKRNHNREEEDNGMISDLSCLQQRLQQQLGEKREKIGKRGKIESDSLKQQQPKRDLYLDTLEKVQQKFLAVTTATATATAYSNSNGGTISSDVSDMQKKLAEIQQQRLKQQQIQPQRDGVLNTEKGDEIYKAKNLDDKTLAEWEELDNQLGKETHQDRSRLLDRRQNGSSEERMTTPFTNNDDEANLPPDATPFNHKKYVTESDYEVAGDGVFLSPEAYQQACESSNPDGSLNFCNLNTSVDDINNEADIYSSPSSRSPNNKNKFISPSTLKALTENPMAPYGKEKDPLSPSNKDKNEEEITIEDLTQQAAISRRSVEDNPEAQEELHRRLMAEEPTYENDESDLFKEALLDSQKAIEFWNQEYLDKQKQESNALDQLLDKKMRELEILEKERKKSNNSHKRNKYNSQELLQKINDRNLYFAPSAKELNERKKMIESDKLERTKTVARLYQDMGDNFWDEFLRKEEVNITKSQKDLQNDCYVQEDEGKDGSDLEIVRETKAEWVFLEDPTSEEDPFYWNSVTGEMRLEPPSES